MTPEERLNQLNEEMNWFHKWMPRIAAVFILFVAYQIYQDQQRIAKSFNTVEVQYIKDNKTGLCFGIVQNKMVEVVCVPCESVSHLLSDTTKEFIGSNKTKLQIK